MPDRPLRLLFCGTNPVQTNGYSKVVYHLAKNISERVSFPRKGGAWPSVEISVYGFQRLRPPVAAGLVEERATPFVWVYDAGFNETPKAAGFGFSEFRQYVLVHRPDVIVVFNDMVVTSNLINQLRDLPPEVRSTFKLVVYADQVYMSQRKEFVNFVNERANAAIAFTPRWEHNLRQIGVTLPTYHLPHGLDTDKVFPVPRDVARAYFGFAREDFLVLNLNRNTQRKRWDKCLQAFAEVLAREPDARIRLVVAAEVRGSFDLGEIFERELCKWGIPLATGLRHLIVLPHPQRMSDADVNALYNAVDVGINCCDGEGFGLCNFENAAVGVPQVVSAVGGLRDFLDDSCAVLVQPVTSFYQDNRDGIGGESHMCDKAGFVEGILRYFRDPELRARHGRAARATIAARYDWLDIAARLCDIVLDVAGDPDAAAALAAAEAADTAKALASRFLMVDDGDEEEEEVAVAPPKAPAAAAAAAAAAADPLDASPEAVRRLMASARIRA